MYQSTSRSAGAFDTTDRGIGPNDLAWTLAIVATVALILFVNPVGFRGGGADDYQYLEAARCWVAHGPCLPHDHWQGRWPVIAPIAASIALLGDSAVAVGLPSLLFAAICLALTAAIGNRVAGRPVGYVAALLLATMPVFGTDLLDPNVDSVELACLLAAMACLLSFAKKSRTSAAFGAGLLWSLAFQARETAVFGLFPLIVFAVRQRPRPSALAAVAVGALLPILAELISLWVQTGDPLWRRHLSMAHVRIASSELSGVDLRQSPFFNRAFIAGWHREPGIHLHWAVDGLINLVANLRGGAVFMLAILAIPLSWPGMPRRDRAIVRWCLLLALASACALIFALAVDPKPRMILVPFVATAMALAVALRSAHRRGAELLALSAAATACVLGLTVIANEPRISRSLSTTARWAAAYPGQIEADATATAHLALDPSRSRFAREGSGRPLLMLRLEPDCDNLRASESATLTLVDRVSLDPFGRSQRGAFCLFHRAGRDFPAR